MPAHQINAFITERVTFKKFKLNQTMSDETPSYSADVYVDGVKAGSTMNHGHGGDDMESFTPEGEAALKAIAAELGEDVLDSVEVMLHTLVWQLSDAKVAARFRKQGLPVTLMMGECGGDMVGLPSKSDVAKVLADTGYDGPYRVVGEDFPVVNHDSMDAFVAAYLSMPLVRGKRTPVYNAPQAVSFIVSEVEHRFTDEAYTEADGRMFARFVTAAKAAQAAKSVA